MILLESKRRKLRDRSRNVRGPKHREKDR